MSELRLNTDGHIIKFGADNDVSLTHVADTGLLLNSTMQLQFNDASQNINAPSATVLDINATDEIELNATAVDLNGTLDVSGTLTQTGVATFSARSVHSSGITIANAGQIGSVGDADSMAIASDGVVTFTQAPVFPDGSLALADLDIDGGTDIGAAIVDADLFIIDDGAGGTNRKTTAARLKTYIGDNTPAFSVRLASDQTIANNTWTKLAFATEILDSDGKFASNAFTPTVAGYYLLSYSIYYDVVDDNEILSLKIYKNGSGDNAADRNNFATGTNNDIHTWGNFMIYLDADDYVELYTKQGSGGNGTAYVGTTTFSGFRVSGV